MEPVDPKKAGSFLILPLLFTEKIPLNMVPHIGAAFLNAELQLYYVFRCRPFETIGDIEADTLAFGQPLEAFTLNCAVMNKKISAFIIFDETIAFAFIEPFYRAF